MKSEEIAHENHEDPQCGSPDLDAVAAIKDYLAFYSDRVDAIQELPLA